MSTVPDWLKSRCDEAGIVIESHPYDIGYFERLFGAPHPSNLSGLEGWRDCGQELAAEATGEAS